MQFMNRLGLSPYGDEDAKTGNYDDEIHSPLPGMPLAFKLGCLVQLATALIAYCAWMWWIGIWWTLLPR